MFEYGKKAKSFRLIPTVIFIYDCSRLFFLIALLGFFLKLGPESGIIKFPLLVYTAPNALFPLMSLFLLIHFDFSRAYIPLYITGKFLGLLCMMVWILFSLRFASHSSLLFWAVSLGAADLGTIMGMATAAYADPSACTEHSAYTEHSVSTDPAEGGE